MTPEQTADWQTKLEALRLSLEQEFASLKDAARPVDLGEPIGRISRMDAMQQQQMDRAHRERIRGRIQMIGAALRRLEAGEFGECLSCGEDIEPRRLDARPESTLCMDCQKGRS